MVTETSGPGSLPKEGDEIPGGDRCLGAKVLAGERLYGTVFFTGEEAEESPVDDPQADLELIAELVGRETGAT